MEIDHGSARSGFYDLNEKFLNMRGYLQRIAIGNNQRRILALFKGTDTIRYAKYLRSIESHTLHRLIHRESERRRHRGVVWKISFISVPGIARDTEFDSRFMKTLRHGERFIIF